MGRVSELIKSRIEKAMIRFIAYASKPIVLGDSFKSLEEGPRVGYCFTVFIPSSMGT